MNFRAYADNVVIELEPAETETASGLALVESTKGAARGHRFARVIKSGPGHWAYLGQSRDAQGRWTGDYRQVFVPNEVKEGDRVIVDALAGQNYDMDLTVPRHNKSQEFQELFGDRGQFRIIREQEILAVFE
jgi:co-chaperonin GroES (HSP10)